MNVSSLQNGITLPVPKIEKPPTKSESADPTTCCACLNEAIMEIDNPSLPPLLNFSPIVFNLGKERIKCSGEWGKKRQYKFPLLRSLHGFVCLHYITKGNTII